MKAKAYFTEIFAKNEKHDPIINGIRAISVLSIIAFHVLVGIIQVFDSAKAQEFILNMPSLLQPLWHGEKGVDAFFLLSGLVIGIPIFKKLDQFDLKSATAFYRKKLYRIYPLFLVALGLYTIAQWEHFGKFFFSNLFFLNNIVPGERTIIPVGWFLTVEMQYFVLVPLLFLLLKRVKLPGLALFVLFLASFFATAAVLLENPQLYMRPITDLFLATDKDEFSTLMGRQFYEADQTRFGPFVAGLLLAYLRTNYALRITEFFSKKTQSIWAFAAAGILIATPLLTPIYDPTSWYYRPFSEKLNFVFLAGSRQAFALGIAILVLGCASSGVLFKGTSRVLSWRFWQPISKLSFPIYLFHFPFIAVAAVAVFGTTDVKEITAVTFTQGAAIFLLASVLTFIFSIPLYIYVERPFVDRVKNRSS